MSGVFFFFQAEDGIRVSPVTGVQTCALPIFNGGLSNGLFAVHVGLYRTDYGPVDGACAQP